MADNLADAFNRELKRNIEFLEIYIKLGPAGQFGAIMIKQKIQAAHDVLASGDIVKMLLVYEELKATE